MKNEIHNVIDELKNNLTYQKNMGVTEIPASVSKPKKADTKAAPNIDKQALLDGVRKEIGDCKRCRLCEQRTNIVFGVGNPNADLMFVGEGPGRDEDIQGLPFVGRSGQLLTKIINAMGLQRSDVFIGNVVKCLKYNAMIQLGNNKWERIGKLVRDKYRGTVKSVNSKGEIVNKRVIGWHATKLGNRQVYKLTFKSAKPAGSHICAIYLTGDHPVLTKRGYVKVRGLKKNDFIATGQGLSETTKNLIYGMLLGDGHITKKQTYLSFSHSIKQEKYAKFKMKLLQNELGCSSKYYRVSAGFNKRYPIIKCHTPSYRSLRIVRNEFYSSKNVKKVPFHLEKSLTPITLAIWFMDDGYMRIRAPRQPSAEIATCAFKVKDIKILSKGIKALDIDNYIRRNRIFFDVEATKKLSEVIAPYVPPSMRWKLHPKIAHKIPFNSKLFIQAKQETFYDKVITKKIIHRGADKTFFCIDVADINNFVTTGGVVHNCRPPENRNPLPDEIKTCMPFLMKQLEIIKPKIIVCLGTFGAQTILATEQKITALRGKFHEWNGVKVMPTFHPAFLLRNPNMKKPVWDDMKMVMKELGI